MSDPVIRLMEATVRIGELARRSGTSVRSLRYYEEQDLLHSERSPSGQRIYEEAAVERVEMLRQLYDAGLTSRVIAELLPCTYAPSVATNDHAFERMVEERRRLRAHVDRLSATREQLDTFIANNRRWRRGQDVGSGA